MFLIMPLEMFALPCHSRIETYTITDVLVLANEVQRLTMPLDSIAS